MHLHMGATAPYEYVWPRVKVCVDDNNFMDNSEGVRQIMQQ